VCDLEEIKENDYNLNISRYVDTTEPEVPVIIEEVMDELKGLEAQREETNSRLSGYLKELGY
jgi:type I restriction enzyme M protein